MARFCDHCQSLVEPRVLRPLKAIIIFGWIMLLPLLLVFSVLRAELGTSVVPLTVYLVLLISAHRTGWARSTIEVCPKCGGRDLKAVIVQSPDMEGA